MFPGMHNKFHFRHMDLDTLLKRLSKQQLVMWMYNSLERHKGYRYQNITQKNAEFKSFSPMMFCIHLNLP